MTEVIELNPAYSTTRSVREVAAEKVEEELQAKRDSEAQFETHLLRPQAELRRGEGGLRTKGYFKNRSGDKPLITVITVVLNGEKHLEETIHTVLSQTYDNIEFIIIDGGSADATLDIILKYEHAIDYWVSEKDKGIYDAMNKGLCLSTGEWIYFLNADDYLSSKKVIEHFQDSIEGIGERVALVYGSINIETEYGELIYQASEPSHLAKLSINHKLSVPHQSQFTRLSAIKEVGKFDISYKIAGDYEMAIRLLKSHDCHFLAGFVVANVRLGGVSSDPQNSLTLLQEYRRAQIENGFHLTFEHILSKTRVYLRLALEKLMGQVFTYKILDYGNKISGRRSHWNKKHK